MQVVRASWSHSETFVGTGRNVRPYERRMFGVQNQDVGYFVVRPSVFTGDVWRVLLEGARGWGGGEGGCT